MEKIRIPTGEIIYQKRLTNGLMVFILPKPKFLRTYAVLSTHYGSLDSKFKESCGGVVDVPAGIAHFLEHKLFEEEGGNVFGRFAELGASVNAFTSHSQTSYLFSTTENWKKSLISLMEFVNSPYLTSENVEKEKGIIEQELQMYADHPSHRVHSNLLEGLYHENPVRLDIGGTVASVYETTVDDLLRCYNAFYQPSNMALAVVGDVEPGETYALIESKYPVQNSNSTPVERVYPEELKQVVKSKVEAQLNISRPRYLLGFKHDPIKQGLERLRQQILMSIGLRLIVGRSSKSFEKLYNADLVTDSFGASYNSQPQYAYSVIGSETDDPDALHGELVSIIDDLKAGGVQADDVERLKRQIYGEHLVSYDSFEHTANSVIYHYFNGTPYFQYLDLVTTVTSSEVQHALNSYLNWEFSTVSVLNPVENHG